MGLFRILFGYRWSLNIVRGGQQVVYKMQCDCPVTIAGFVMGYFAAGCQPIEPWSLHLSFKRNRRPIELGAQHFTAHGHGLTPVLVKAIEVIDPQWTSHVSEPVFEEAATKRRLKITQFPLGQTDMQVIYDNIGKPREADFFDIMDMVFGKTRTDMY